MGLLSDSISVLKEIVQFFNRILSRPSKQIAKVVKIYDEMHRVLDDTEAQRFLIFKAHNGGGLIRANTPLYVSILHEDYSPPFPSVKEKYQQLRVDSDYIRMLDEICREKSVVLETKNMKPQLLKDIYLAEGVNYTEIFFLGQDRKNLYFASVGSAREKGWTAHLDQVMSIKLAINHIRNNIM